MAAVGVMPYIGRFAPSPTGALHAGSLVAALASWLDARAHGGSWLVRIEDVDTPRCVLGVAQEILRQLAACGLVSDQEPVFQSARAAHYQAALDRLVVSGCAFACACSRKDIEAAWAARGGFKERHGELVYPGTCREGLHFRAGHRGRAWRFKIADLEVKTLDAGVFINKFAIKSIVNWVDRRLASQHQDVAQQVGDFVLRRSDGLWAYQLAVVVDDALQGITHVVRGEDLADNTPRQILLQQALGYARPAYLHTPLVLAADGQKLSKQNAAQPLALVTPQQSLLALQEAARVLQLPPAPYQQLADALAFWVRAWPFKITA
jgi:glutamyl-Q tRNA(Asp) synthetase